ncbi:dephospho-CoA kinase [Jeongeupia chitinilytica]|uniref:Dephospho-CoA kinase n=1 Tax=Jeongeupia chitinilytica TaxID=1041641 RepID=A0ABQ3H684_9NEIS|nr:dephospho-CoA kinase [Jeongeupia chitinilytica]GHD69606.1 dephospho-CoA kinase [Jeongeupia chitinilytica]
MIMQLIGLTGGIASGKSTVSALFTQHGVPVIDADVIAHRLSQPSSPALEAIRSTFGPDAVDAHGALARDWMRQHVFGHAEARTRLEAILHPLILAELDQGVAALPSETNYALIAVPLLFEAKGFRERVARALVVDCSEERQRQRLMNRPGMNDELADAIIASQLPRQTRLQYADDIIDNEGSLEELAEAVALQHQRYLTWSAAASP